MQLCYTVALLRFKIHFVVYSNDQALEILLVNTRNNNILREIEENSVVSYYELGPHSLHVYVQCPFPTAPTFIPN